MPNAPKKKKRPWVAERKPHQRLINMDWFYQDKRWRRFTKGFNLRHPLCKNCEDKGIETPTCVVDHKVRFVDGGPGFDLDDLKDEYFEPLCDYRFNKCHEIKSGKEGNGYKRGMG